MSKRVFIIAEAGVNHNGDMNVAKRLVDAASQSGADAVKFQTFKAKNIANVDAPKANYQKKTTSSNENQYEMLKKLELSEDNHKELIECCKTQKIMFLSSPFDLESIDSLKSLGVNIWKIPSGEITNLPYLRKIGSFDEKVILSTGMSNLGEIESALNILITAGSKKENISLLHCNTEYPTPMKDVNLNAMITMKNAFKVNVGYSDHTLGIEISIAAAALGATIIEKHFTLDKTFEGPDHRASLEPEELKQMVKSIRNIESALGNGIKKPSPSEEKNIDIARKSIVAKKDINVGELFSKDNLTVKRPGNGLSPMTWDEIIGSTSKKCFFKNELIKI